MAIRDELADPYAGVTEGPNYWIAGVDPPSAAFASHRPVSRPGTTTASRSSGTRESRTLKWSR